jgi:hypothetical protein
MNIPRNGRVVVIDDVPAEGLPLVRVLSKNKIPAAYFTGLNKDELPDKPMSGVRIIFLDIILGTDGQNDKTKVSTAISVLKHVVAQKEKSPYLLIAWTKHEELVAGIKDGLKDNPPVFILNLRKNQCKYQDGSYNLKKIEQKLKSGLRNVGAFHLFALWENIVHQSAGKIVDDFSSFYPLDANWNKNMFRVFRALAEAYAGKRLLPGDINEISRNSLLTFNMAFLDNLESGIGSFQSFGKIAGKRPRGTPDADVISKINSRLLVTYSGDDDSIKPGNIYEGRINRRRCASVQDLYNGELSQFPQQRNLIAAVKNIYLEVSPVCDYTQNKLRAYRFLPGLLWPVEYSKQIKKTADYLYVSPLVNIKNNKYKLVFDIRCLTTLPVNTPRHNKKILARVRHELLVDIQSYIARHVSRPGVTSVICTAG